MDLRATWTGKALFTAAYLRTLPRSASASSQTPPKPTVPTAPKRRVSTKGMRFYEVLRTNHGARAGTKRATQLDIVLAHTNTHAAKLAGAETIDINFAETLGLIRFT